MAPEDTSVLIIYTGGTIGMISDPETGAYMPFNLDNILDAVPEIGKFGFNLEFLEFENPIDSSMISPKDWKNLGRIIEENYHLYNGFVVLHGTDTMAYTASALSFMFQNLSKPIILTGAQLPINTLRTDGRENLMTSIQIAASRDREGNAVVPEVCIYFEFRLYRGNRTVKLSADHFKAFESTNYPPLAQAGIEIDFNSKYIQKANAGGSLSVRAKFDESVAIVRLFPGIGESTLKSVFQSPGVRGVVLESYGSGNAPEQEWFLSIIRNAVNAGVVVLNVSQCVSGKVSMERYKTGRGLLHAGVVSGRDMTTEAAITKLMHGLALYRDVNGVIEYLETNIAGEMTT